ncbi:energy-coupling factor transporter transmembrane component T [Paenibacillus sp. D2_2]|uniref:energy-coupling factor transporter transmembrane component T family protein n=1 Tax=Paenibacillus sp. D2_2 TaxID=3073092 RepID=UPI002815B79D|nr:energy-coupling factor transporter transmembrane component T [Paenibacillus sp. D2_2]WMT43122.1 energy-coupling factor transporter transmembrane component T [Paenibacillus sp. D2_2]
MGNKILLGQYVETNSIIHRLDPRSKLVCMLAMMLSFFTLQSLINYTAATVIVFFVLLLSRIPFHKYARGLKPLLFILMFTFVYHALMTEGTVIWSWSVIKITTEGLQNGSFVVWRIILLILLSSVLTLTTKPLTLAQGLEKLMSPLSKLHVPIEQFSLMIVIAIRFIPTIVEELDRIMLAQKARGYDIASLKLPRRMFAYIPLLVPLLITTIQRAEQLSLAINARAYGNGRGRTVYKQLKLKRIDYLVACFTAILALIMLLS